MLVGRQLSLPWFGERRALNGTKTTTQYEYSTDFPLKINTASPHHRRNLAAMKTADFFFSQRKRDGRWLHSYMPTQKAAISRDREDMRQFLRELRPR